jgi:hypothetical protein
MQNISITVSNKSITTLKVRHGGCVNDVTGFADANNVNSSFSSLFLSFELNYHD